MNNTDLCNKVVDDNVIKESRILVYLILQYQYCSFLTRVLVGFGRVIFFTFVVWKLVLTTYEGNEEEEKKLKIHKAICSREDKLGVSLSYTLNRSNQQDLNASCYVLF